MQRNCRDRGRGNARGVAARWGPRRFYAPTTAPTVTIKFRGLRVDRMRTMSTDNPPIRACFHCVHGRHDGASICWHPDIARAKGPARCEDARAMSGMCGPEATMMRFHHEHRPREDSPSVRQVQASIQVDRHVRRNASEPASGGDAARAGEQCANSRCPFGVGGECVPTCRNGLIYTYCARKRAYRKTSHGGR